MVENMPLESRRAGSLARLTAAVFQFVETGADQNPNLHTFGGGGQMWHLDGGTIQGVTMEEVQPSMNPPLESIREFKVAASGYPAEFGRVGGTQMIMTTRSGTNEFHGALYEYFRNDALDARSFFAAGKAPLRYNIFGGSIGGPLVRNQTFFFLNYEGARRHDGGSFPNQEVPHPPEIAGDFSNRTDLIVVDPLTAEPFLNNIIPQDRLDPVGRAFARLWPAPNHSNNDNTKAPVDNYSSLFSDRLTQDFVTVRLDRAFGDKHRLYGRVSHVRAPEEKAPLFPDAAVDRRAEQTSNKQTHATVSWAGQISASTLHEFRYTLGRRGLVLRGGGLNSWVNGKVGLRGVSPNGIARITIPGHLQLGNSDEFVQSPVRSHQLIHNTTRVRGRHQIKTGFEFRYSEDTIHDNGGANGFFHFDPRPTGNSLATLLLGWTTRAASYEADLLNTRSDHWAVFFQDDWKLTRRLTLNAGLRWETDTPRWETQNHQSGFDPQPMNPVSNTPGIVTFAGRDGRSKYSHDFDLNNFGPRFGFAYRWGSSFVARGAYGIHYNQPYGGLRTNQGFSLGFRGQQSLGSPDGGFTPPFLFKDGLPAAPERQELWPGFGAVPPGDAAWTRVSFFEQNRATGYVQHWNFTLQKQFGTEVLLETGYLAAVGHKLDTLEAQLNEIPLVDGKGPERQDHALRPFPQFFRVMIEAPSWENSSYHALGVKLEKRYSRGLNLLLNYTWSKALDDRINVHRDLRHLDKSLSAIHMPHRLIASAAYALPLGRNQKWALCNAVFDHILGGWSLGAITEFRSGRSIGPIFERVNRTNTFSSYVKPNLLRDPTIRGERPREEKIREFFDTSAFESPPSRVFGTAPMRISPGPGFAGIDLSAQKNWIVKDYGDLHFRMDMFNLPNKPNFWLVGDRHGAADFGRIQATWAARRIQFGLRFRF